MEWITKSLIPMAAVGAIMRSWMRGTFANIRIKNELADGKIGGYTDYKGELLSIYEAAMRYKEEQIDTIVLAGKDYGMGSSRDWAAKGG